MAKEVENVGGVWLVSTEFLSEVMGVSPRAIAKWADAGCPKAARGKWNLKEVIEWRGLASIGTKSGASVNLAQKKLEAEVAWKETQGALMGLRKDIMSGKYLDRDYVKQELDKFFVILKRSIMLIPRRVAGEIAGYVDPVTARRIENELTATMNDALEQLSVGGVYNASKAKKR